MSVGFSGWFDNVVVYHLFVCCVLYDLDDDDDDDFHYNSHSPSLSSSKKSFIRLQPNPHNPIPHTSLGPASREGFGQELSSPPVTLARDGFPLSLSLINKMAKISNFNPSVIRVESDNVRVVLVVVCDLCV